MPKRRLFDLHIHQEFTFKPRFAVSLSIETKVKFARAKPPLLRVGNRT